MEWNLSSNNVLSRTDTPRLFLVGCRQVGDKTVFPLDRPFQISTEQDADVPVA